jgi:hypothetical protein
MWRFQKSRCAVVESRAAGTHRPFVSGRRLEQQLEMEDARLSGGVGGP